MNNVILRETEYTRDAPCFIVSVSLKVSSRKLFKMISFLKDFIIEIRIK
jgi:hypothetical protein